MFIFLIKSNVNNIAWSYQRTTIRITSQLLQHSKEPLQIYSTKVQKTHSDLVFQFCTLQGFDVGLIESKSPCRIEMCGLSVSQNKKNGCFALIKFTEYNY